MWDALVHHIVRPHVIVWPRNVTGVGVRSPLLGLVAYSVTYFHSKIQDCPCTGAADVNGASQQPTSRHWNRCSEDVDNARLVRKWRAMAFTTAQYVGVSVAWVVSMWRAINSITGDTFWKPATGLKSVNWLTGYRFNKPKYNEITAQTTHGSYIWQWYMTATKSVNISYNFTGNANEKLHIISVIQ